MVGWHYWLDGHEFEQALGVDDGQGGLAMLQSMGLHSRKWLSNWTDNNSMLIFWKTAKLWLSIFSFFSPRCHACNVCFLTRNQTNGLPGNSHYTSFKCQYHLAFLLYGMVPRPLPQSSVSWQELCMLGMPYSLFDLSCTTTFQSTACLTLSILFSKVSFFNTFSQVYILL